MSTRALERTDWRGEGVDVAAVLGALARLESEHFTHPHGHATTHTLNLVVGPASAGAGARVEQLLRSLVRSHPSRTIFLRRHEADRLDAEVAIECDVGGPGAGLCHDRALLYADGPRLERAASLVRPLLVRGLPTVAWLPDPDEAALEESLARLGDAVVMDSGIAPDAPRGLRRAAALAARARVCDLAWGRIDRWRARIAAAFDEPGRLDALDRAPRLVVAHSGCAADALLLCGWIATRAGWRLEALRREGGEPGRFAGGAARPAGGEVPVEVAISLVAPAGADPAVERVEIAGTVALERGALLQHPADELADALAAGDAYTRGHPEALAALDAAMEPAA